MDYSYEGIKNVPSLKKNTRYDNWKIKYKNKIIIGTKISTYNPNFIGSTKLKWIREGSKS